MPACGSRRGAWRWCRCGRRRRWRRRKRRSGSSAARSRGGAAGLGCAMVKATWHGATIAESDDTVVVEGNQYFPPDSVDSACLRPSDSTTRCPWKGVAHYYHVVVEGAENRNAPWYYPDPKPAAGEIRDHLAFWKGVEVG